MVYLMMGVAGSGKSTIGKLLAERLGIPFHDGDDYHPKANIEKMSRGIALTDEDRVPWLQVLAAAIAEWNRGPGAVLACSALKRAHRAILAGEGTGKVTFIHLHGPSQLLKRRLQSRKHFFPPTLLESQLETLEVPTDAISIDVDASPEEICRKVVEELSQRGLVKPVEG